MAPDFRRDGVWTPVFTVVTTFYGTIKYGRVEGTLVDYKLDSSRRLKVGLYSGARWVVENDKEVSSQM